MAEVTPTDVYVYSRSVRGGMNSPRHTFGCIIYTPAWVSCSVRFNEMAVVGQAAGRSAVDTPLFECSYIS